MTKHFLVFSCVIFCFCLSLVLAENELPLLLDLLNLELRVSHTLTFEKAA